MTSTSGVIRAATHPLILRTCNPCPGVHVLAGVVYVGLRYLPLIRSRVDGTLDRTLETPVMQPQAARVDEPSADEIRAQVERILASDLFVNSERLCRFLRWAVDRTLAGETGDLKEYALGRDVFDRDRDYDPRIDSIVRVEARRLRAKLRKY